MGDDEPVLPVDPDLAVDHTAEPDRPGNRPHPTRRHRHAQPDVLTVIAAGGMLGATARFELAEAIPTSPGHFPWATFWANLSGSFVLGFVLVLLLERFPPTRYVRPFLVTGVIGAYTTMSTYLVETTVLIKDGHAGTATLYGLGSLVAGLLLAYAGIVAARLTPRRHHHHDTSPEDQ